MIASYGQSPVNRSKAHCRSEHASTLQPRLSNSSENNVLTISEPSMINIDFIKGKGIDQPKKRRGNATRFGFSGCYPPAETRPLEATKGETLIRQWAHSPPRVRPPTILSTAEDSRTFKGGMDQPESNNIDCT